MGKTGDKIILCEFRADQCKWPKKSSLQRLVSPIPWGVRASRCRALPNSPLTPVILACRGRETRSRENRGDAVRAAAWHPPGKIIPSLLHPACNWEALLGGQAGLLLWTHIFTDSSRVILPVQTSLLPVAMRKHQKRIRHRNSWWSELWVSNSVGIMYCIKKFKNCPFSLNLF